MRRWTAVHGLCRFLVLMSAKSHSPYVLTFIRWKLIYSGWLRRFRPQLFVFFFFVSSPFHTMTYFVACDPFSLGRPKRVWVIIALLAHRRRWSLVPLSPLHIRNIFQWWFQLFSLLLGLPGTSIWNTTQAYSIYLMPWGKWYCPLWTHVGRKLDP